MTTPFNDIRAGLETHLANGGFDLPIAWENKTFNPDGDEFIRPTLLPSESVQASLGDDGKTMHAGIFQIDHFVPSDTGRSQIADKIADHFKRGTVIFSGSLCIRITSESIGRAGREEIYFIQPVNIGYQAYAKARQ